MLAIERTEDKNGVTLEVTTWSGITGNSFQNFNAVDGCTKQHQFHYLLRPEISPFMPIIFSDSVVRSRGLTGQSFTAY
jgi:hypothetical protein